MKRVKQSSPHQRPKPAGLTADFRRRTNKSAGGIRCKASVGDMLLTPRDCQSRRRAKRSRCISSQPASRDAASATAKLYSSGKTAWHAAPTAQAKVVGRLGVGETPREGLGRSGNACSTTSSPVRITRMDVWALKTRHMVPLPRRAWGRLCMLQSADNAISSPTCTSTCFAPSRSTFFVRFGILVQDDEPVFHFIGSRREARRAAPALS